MRSRSSLLMLAFAGALLLTSGCAPTRVKLNMDDYAQYNEKYSYARNLARLQRMSRALEDTEVPKDMVTDWGAAGLGTDLLVSNWIYNVYPSMPGNFGVGAGIKIINHLLSGPKAGEYDVMCAFVPVSVAKTEADARDYIVNQMIKGLAPVAKEQGYDLAGTSPNPIYYDEKAKPCDREKAWQLIGSTFVIKESIGCGRTLSDQCLFAVRLEKDTEPQQPAPVPAWIDPEQPMAWFFPTIRVISKLDGVEVSKRDEVRYDWLTAWAKHFPKNTFMYVSPARKDGKPLPPFYTDGKKVWLFVIPEEN